MKERVLAWHFLPEDKRLRWGTREEVRVGRVVRVDCDPVLCTQGLHASKRAIDALEYAPGPILCRVEVRGTILHDSDKLVGTERKCLAMADATTLLHEFACWCAKRALKAAKVDDERCWNAINTKLKWLKGQATDDELDAARDAARAAAWAAAWAAARDAAWDAARAAARDAASAAAWAAARDAARDAQNKHLTSKFKRLLGCD